MTDCIFCKIIAGTIPTTSVYRTEQVTAIRDLNPQAPTHILLLPNKHLASVAEAQPEDEALLGALFLAAKRVAEQENVGSYRLVVNTGAQAGQSVFHLHVHLLGGRAMSWPPG